MFVARLFESSWCNCESLERTTVDDTLASFLRFGLPKYRGDLRKVRITKHSNVVPEAAPPCAHNVPNISPKLVDHIPALEESVHLGHDLHPITSIALKKRMMEKARERRKTRLDGAPCSFICLEAVRRLQLVGDPIDANEAQRFS